MWGAEDLFAATGGTANRWPDGSYRDVAKHVRSQSLLAAKAYGRMALDSVYLDIKDLDGLRAESDDAVAVGFRRQGRHPPDAGGGHPGGVRADRRAGRLGATRARQRPAMQRGVFQFEGIMVDAPVCGGQSASSRWRPTPAASRTGPSPGVLL